MDHSYTFILPKCQYKLYKSFVAEPSSVIMNCYPPWASQVVLVMNNLLCRRHKRCRFGSWVGMILWNRKWKPAPVFLPGRFHGQRNLVGHNPWGRTESDTAEHTLIFPSHVPGTDCAQQLSFQPHNFAFSKADIVQLTLNYTWFPWLNIWFHTSRLFDAGSSFLQKQLPRLSNGRTPTVLSTKMEHRFLVSYLRDNVYNGYGMEVWIQIDLVPITY